MRFGYIISIVLLILLESSLAASIADADRALSQNDYETAIEIYRQYLEENPVSYEARFGLARALAYSGSREEAIRVLDELLADHPNDPDAHLLRGRVLSWGKRFTEAEEDLDFITRNHPDYADAWSALGDLYRWSGRPDEAIEVYTKLIELREDDSEAYLSRARVQMESRYFTAARNDLQSAAELGGESVVIDGMLRAIARHPSAAEWESSCNISAATMTGEGGSDWNLYDAYVKSELNSGSVALGYIRARRWNKWDDALYFDAYWDLWRKAYGNLRIQTAEAEVLPRMDYTLEIFQGIGSDWEVSAGYHLMQFPSNDASIFIVSAAKYIGPLYIRERTLLDPESNRMNQAYSMLTRWYIGRIDDYIDLDIGLSNASDYGSGDLFHQSSLRASAQKFFISRIGVQMSGSYIHVKDGPVERGFSLKLMFRY